MHSFCCCCCWSPHQDGHQLEVTLKCVEVLKFFVTLACNMYLTELIDVFSASAKPLNFGVLLYEVSVICEST